MTDHDRNPQTIKYHHKDAMSNHKHTAKYYKELGDKENTAKHLAGEAFHKSKLKELGK